MEKVYEFAYTNCIYESAMATISLHKTRKGAEIAMEFHKDEKRKYWMESFASEQDRKSMPFGEHEGWSIRERNLLE